MGVSVLILGVSGTGKSASMRNFKGDDIALVNVAGKPLPFKGKFNDVLSNDDYNKVKNFIKDTKKQSIVVDDAQYLMGNEFMRRATEKGYDKFTEMAQNFWKLLNVIKDLPDEKIVYLLGHIELDANGTEKFKTMGKMLDEKINVEGLCTIVLKTNVSDGQFSFVTRNNGHDTVKSPFGMFPTYAIDNDLKYVDDKIRNYYELGKYVSDDQIAEADKQAAKPEIEKPAADGKRRRGRTTEEKTARKEPEEEYSGAKEAFDKAKEKTDDEKPKRRSRKSREEVQAENTEKVVNSGLEEAGDAEEVDYNKVEDPKTETPPRTRKRRGADQEPEAEEETTPRRRRRRAE